MKRTVVTNRMVDRLVELRKTNMSIRDISISTGVAESTVYRHTKDIPEPPEGWKRRGRPRKVDRAKLHLLVKHGLDRHELAERFQVSVSCIKMLLAKAA